MMSERVMILKMLDEGKITLEEADALLEALGHGEVKLEDLEADGEFIKVPPLKPSKVKNIPITPESQEESMNPEELEELWEEKLDQIDEEFDQLEDEVEEMIDEVEDQLDELEDRIEELEDEVIDEEIRSLKINEIEKTKNMLEKRHNHLNERKVKLKEQRKEFEKSYKKEWSITFDIDKGIAELKRAFNEVKKNFKGEGMEDLKAGMKEFTEQLSEGMKGLKEGLEEGTKEVRKAFEGKDLKKMFGNLFRNIGFGFGPGITLEEEITGTFDPNQGPITIDLYSSNGRIEVIGTDDSDYKLHLKYNVHAGSEEEAHELKDQMTTITQSPTLLKFETHRGHFGGVSLKLFIPKRLEAEMKLRSSNGRIEIHGLQTNSPLSMKSSNGRLVVTDLRAGKIEANTSNGRIEFKDFAAEDLNVRTSNGSIFLEGLCDQIVGRTSNGSVTVHPYVSGKGNLDLNTSNGKIKVLLLDPNLAVDLDAKTSMGSVNFNIPNLVIQKEVNKPGRKEYQAQSDNYIGSEKRIQIQAHTSMGSIYIGQQG